MKEKGESLRARHAAATRSQILEAAYHLLTREPAQPFSHEAVAARAGAGVRTVYRYFPTQADLYEELWRRVRREAGTDFPSTPDAILPQVAILFDGFNRNESLIQAVLSSPAGRQVRERGAPEGRQALAQALAPFLGGSSPVRRRQITAVFLGIYSAAFWQLLRDRGGLSGSEAISAASWAMQALLSQLESHREARPPKKGKKS